MSKEEQKAIEYLNNQDNSLKWDFAMLQNIKIILNLIEKQQKEIEEWRKGIRINDTVCVPKDKIREIIKELEQCKKEELKNDDEFGTHTFKWAIADNEIDLLQELLEEN